MNGSFFMVMVYSIFLLYYYGKLEFKVKQIVYIMIYTKEHSMKTARIFSNGRSQAVRLPKEFRFDAEDVFIKKFDNIIMLIPKNDPWAPLINSLDKFSDDFMENRPISKTQKRDLF